MKTSALFILFSVALCKMLSAQSIQGKVMQNNGSAVEFASVVLYRSIDTSLVKGCITKPDGSYSFENVPSGSYLINAQLIGMGLAASPVFEYNGGDLRLEDLRLQEQTTELKGVVITATRQVIEVKADRTVFNVEADINAGGKSAIELLRKAPGVTVDNNDNVSLQGKSGLKFLIDGREVPMDNKDVTDMLKSMRAEDIAAFEMITNPSAKYDASGNAGIINIKTRKNLNLGTNGTVGFDFTQGVTPKGGVNLRLNHRNEKVNVFGNYSNHYGIWHNTLNLYREQDGRVFDQKSNMRDFNRNHNYKAGADFFLNSKHTLGVLFNGRHSEGPWQNSAITSISDLTSVQRIDSIMVAKNTQNKNRDNNSFNINYRFADTSGHVLSIDLDRGFFVSRMNSYQPNTYMNTAMNEIYFQNIFSTITPTDVDISTAKIDYEQNAFRGKIGLGAKVSKVSTDNTFDFYNVKNGESQKDDMLSNRFKYDEMVSAAYANYNTKYKKWSMQAGLRLEAADILGELVAATPQLDKTVDLNYVNLFPSASVAYEMNKKNQFSLSYSRRIDRPSYQDLNPFEVRLDELSYQKGNPFLRPQYSHNLSLTHTFMQFVNTTLSYSHTNDVFTEVIDTTRGNRTFLINENIANQDNIALTLGVPIPIAKWWEGYLSLTGFYNHFEANYRPGFAYEVDIKSFNLYSEHNLKLPKDWTLSLSGWYDAPSIWGGVFRSKAQGAMDFGVKKKILKGDGELTLNFGDILRTAGWKSVNDFTPGLYMRGSGTWESRTVSLNGTYRFGNKNVKAARQRQTGLEEEGRRIKSGN